MGAYPLTSANFNTSAGLYLVLADIDWASEMRLWAPVIAALGTLLAAGAAWASARASRKAASTGERASIAAMLGVIPLAHPSVDLAGGAEIMNRGSSEAVGLNWRIVAEDDEDQVVVEGTLTKVLPPQISRSVLEAPNEELAVALRSGRHIFVCEYQTSWGESFTVRRLLRRADAGRRVNADVTVIDSSGRRMRVSDR